MINVLHISPNFNYSCGVSKYVFQLLKYYSQKNNYKLFFVTNGGDALDKLKDISIEPQIINFSIGWKNIFHYRNNIKSLLNFCINNNISIIHTHHRYAEYLAYQLSKKIDVKTVATVHSIVKGKKTHSFMSNKIIAVSNSVKQNLIDNYHIAPGKIIRLYNYLELTESQINNSSIPKIKKRIGIHTDNKILLFVGRICVNKGSDILLNAFKILEQEVKNITLLMVGSIEKNMNSFLKKYNSENVLFISPQKDMDDYYIISDIVILPSRVESLGYTMLEAGLYKKPFVGSRTGGIEEFIETGKDGILVEPEETEELIKSIKQLLRNDDQRVSLGNNLYQKVLPLTDADLYFKNISSIYNKLLD